jgi:hypothetical protein
MMLKTSLFQFGNCQQLLKIKSELSSATYSPGYILFLLSPNLSREENTETPSNYLNMVNLNCCWVGFGKAFLLT